MLHSRLCGCRSTAAKPVSRDGTVSMLLAAKLKGGRQLFKAVMTVSVCSHNFWRMQGSPGTEILLPRNKGLPALRADSSHAREWSCEHFKERSAQTLPSQRKPT